MSLIKLDRSRDFATVHGEGMTHAFEQDGLPFDHHGSLVEALVPPDKQAMVEKKLRRLAKKVDKGTDQPTSSDGDEAQGSDINFELWLKDEARYQPHELYNEARRRFSKNFSNLTDLAEFLVFDENVCPPEDVPTKLGQRGA